MVNPKPDKLIIRVEKRFFSFIRKLQFIKAKFNSRRVKSLKEFRGHDCQCTEGQGFHFVHSVGIREIADIIVDFGSDYRHPKRKALLPSGLNTFAHQIPAYSILYVFTDCFDNFVETTLPLLKQPVVLVTGCSDISPVQKHRQLLGHTMIAHWFALNCDIYESHPKLSLIPLGLCNPVFNNLERRIWFLIDQLEGKIPFDPFFKKNPKGDQAKLRKIANKMPNVQEKPNKVLCTFYTWPPENHKNTIERNRAYEMLKGNDLFHFSPRLAQDKCWEIHSEFAFEISPHGYGLDCYRTWEALALKTIPIVKTSTLDRLYLENDLPVVIVRDWDEITVENLEIWKAKFADKFDDALETKLSNDYWTKRIKAKQFEFLTAIPQI